MPVLNSLREKCQQGSNCLTLPSPTIGEGNSRLLAICLVLIFCCFQNMNAQDVSHMRGKKRLLKGEWQLVSTFTEGKDHTIPKEEYDGVIRFRSMHRYEEEVNYESMHWIIKGKWKVYRHKATLLLSKRHYTLGEMEKNPVDIIFELVQLDKQHWTGASTANGAPVKVSYQKIPRK
jgi:hypothetical protein